MAGVSIVGIGAISAAGYDLKEAFAKITNGESALKPLSIFDHGLKEVPLSGEISDDPQKKLPFKTPNRSTALALIAAEQALKDVVDKSDFRLGLFVATTVGGMTESEIFFDKYLKKESIKNNASQIFSNHEPAAMTGFIAEKIGANGVQTLSTACSTSLHSLGMAKRAIEKDKFDLALVIGVDALSILTIRGFASLMLIDSNGCRPFDKNRIGISIGEGAGALLLASYKAQEKLGLKSKAIISGWGASADAHHMTAPHPEGQGAAMAMRAAIKEANISPVNIDMVLAHGTATPDNDIAEIKAMRSIFKELPPFTSLKGVLGHTLAASGTLEVVYGIMAMNSDIIPPCSRFKEYDEAIGATPCNGKKIAIKHFLKNAFGFGGNNAVVVISNGKEN